MSDLPAVLEHREVANKVPAVIDAQYREVRVYRPPPLVHRSRSVVLPAGLVSLVILGASLAVYAALAWSARP